MEEIVIQTRTAKIWLGDDGIVRDIFYLLDAQLTITDMQSNMEAIIAVGGGKKRPIFSDGRSAKSIDREARLYGASDAVGDYCSALAVLVDSALSKMIGNIFVLVNKPKYPTRLFTSESEAIEWLKGFINE